MNIINLLLFKEYEFKGNSYQYATFVKGSHTVFIYNNEHSQLKWADNFLRCGLFNDLYFLLVDDLLEPSKVNEINMFKHVYQIVFSKTVEDKKILNHILNCIAISDESSTVGIYKDNLDKQKILLYLGQEIRNVYLLDKEETLNSIIAHSKLVDWKDKTYLDITFSAHNYVNDPNNVLFLSDLSMDVVKNIRPYLLTFDELYISYQDIRTYKLLSFLYEMYQGETPFKVEHNSIVFQKDHESQFNRLSLKFNKFISKLNERKEACTYQLMPLCTANSFYFNIPSSNLLNQYLICLLLSYFKFNVRTQSTVEEVEEGIFAKVGLQPINDSKPLILDVKQAVYQESVEDVVEDEDPEMLDFSEDTFSNDSFLTGFNPATIEPEDDSDEADFEKGRSSDI